MINCVIGVRGAALAGMLLIFPASQQTAQSAEPQGFSVSERALGARIADPQKRGLAKASDNSGDQPSERYELASGDRLKIIFFQNADLSGEFRIQGDGRVSVPLLGSFSAVGKTAAEIATEIAVSFQRGDQQAAQVVVEVAEWRPLYITGHVSKPGGYAFTPGMTILHAISIAGGMYRVLDGTVGTSIGVSHLLGQVEGTKERLKLALARMAALAAERANRETAEVPLPLIALSGKADAEALVAVENRSLRWRRDALKDRVEARGKEVALTKDEIAAFRGQLQQIKEQKRLKRLQLDDIQTLAEKGLSRRNDVLNLQSVLADLERDEREVFGAIARAERALTRADQELRELPVTRKLEIEKEINELLQQIASYESMISASRDVVGRIAGAQQQAEQEQIRFTIMRKTGQNERFFAAKETTSLHAGDVVIVAVQENRASSMFRGDQTSKEGIDIETTGVLAKGQTGRIPSQEISPR